jgi:hypothetical protein
MIMVARVIGAFRGSIGDGHKGIYLGRGRRFVGQNAPDGTNDP